MKYFAPFTLDLAASTLWRDGVRVPLTHKAIELLGVLVARAGHVVPKEALLQAVWPETHVHPDNVKVLVGEIRKALGDDPVRPKFIRSLVKRGYIFIAPVVEAAASAVGRPAFPIFVGRDHEMDRLLAALDDASIAQRQVLLVSGEAGIGKTALCEAFLRIAGTRHPIRAGWAQCMKVSGSSEPYYPMIDLLTRLSRSAGDDSVTSVLAKHAPSWLPHLPALAGDSMRGRTGGTAVATAARMLREIVTALEALSEQTTLVLWIEDLQWADPATIDVLTSLGQRRDSARLLILITLRPPDSAVSSITLRRAQLDLIGRPHTSELRLQPLAIEDVTRYLELRLGADVARLSAGILFRLTGGNPLFLVTAIEHLLRKGHSSSAAARGMSTSRRRHSRRPSRRAWWEPSRASSTSSPPTSARLSTRPASSASSSRCG